MTHLVSWSPWGRVHMNLVEALPQTLDPGRRCWPYWLYPGLRLFATVLGPTSGYETSNVTLDLSLLTEDQLI